MDFKYPITNQKHGKKHGKYQRWFRNGKLFDESNYTNGKEDIEDNIEYKETIYNEIEYEKNNLIEYSKINYLLVKLVDNMDWDKLVRLSNSYKNGVVEEDIVEIGTETMIINTYFDKTDFTSNQWIFDDIYLPFVN